MRYGVYNIYTKIKIRKNTYMLGIQELIMFAACAYRKGREREKEREKEKEGGREKWG